MKYEVKLKHIVPIKNIILILIKDVSCKTNNHAVIWLNRDTLYDDDNFCNDGDDDNYITSVVRKAGTMKVTQVKHHVSYLNNKPYIVFRNESTALKLYHKMIKVANNPNINFKITTDETC